MLDVGVTNPTSARVSPSMSSLALIRLARTTSMSPGPDSPKSHSYPLRALHAFLNSATACNIVVVMLWTSFLLTATSSDHTRLWYRALTMVSKWTKIQQEPAAMAPTSLTPWIYPGPQEYSTQSHWMLTNFRKVWLVACVHTIEAQEGASEQHQYLQTGNWPLWTTCKSCRAIHMI